MTVSKLLTINKLFHQLLRQPEVKMSYTCAAIGFELTVAALDVSNMQPTSSGIT